MNWRFVNTGFNTGKFNMAYDMQLAKNCKPGEAVLRLYRWKPYCISLAPTKDLNKINIEKAEEDNIDVVKRPNRRAGYSSCGRINVFCCNSH